MSDVSPASGIDLQTDPRLAQLRRTTGQVVGTIFYGTLLKSMRNSALRGEYGHGGYGEKVFEGQLDAELATRAGMAKQNGLTAAVLARLAPQQLRIAGR